MMPENRTENRRIINPTMPEANLTRALGIFKSWHETDYCKSARNGNFLIIRKYVMLVHCISLIARFCLR